MTTRRGSASSPPKPEFDAEELEEIRGEADLLLESGIACDEQSARDLAQNAVRHRKKRRAEEKARSGS